MATAKRRNVMTSSKARKGWIARRKREARLAELERQGKLPVGDLLTTVQAAILLHKTPGSLAAWRNEKRGPAFVRMGGIKGRILYPRKSIDAWLAKNTITPGKDRAA